VNSIEAWEQKQRVLEVSKEVWRRRIGDMLRSSQVIMHKWY